MNSDDLKKVINKWVAAIGEREAVKRLIQIDIALAVTQKLVKGHYKSELSFDKAQAILNELAKDGFRLADDHAS